MGRKQASAGQVSGAHNGTTAPVCDPSSRIWGLASRFLTHIHQELPEPLRRRQTSGIWNVNQGPK